MQILRLLAARRFRGRLRRRRAVSTITATAPCTPWYGEGEDEGPFFDLDLATCRSAPASTAGSQAAESSSGSESDDSSFRARANATAGDLDFVISLHRSGSSTLLSPSYEERLFFRPPPPKFCASESRRFSASASRSSRALPLRTLSFGSAKAALYGGGRASSFSRSSTSARSAFATTYGVFGSPDLGDRDAEARPRSGDVFRRYLGKISSRLRRVAAADGRLRKSRSAPAAHVVGGGQSQSPPPPPARRDDTLLEKQDGIASAIAHCKESLHRASISECDTSLLRSRSLTPRRP